MKGFIVYSTYRYIGDSPYVFIFGRLENNEAFVAVTPFKHYFYIKESDMEKAKRLETFESEKTKFKTFNGEKAAKIFVEKPSDMPELRRLFESNAIQCYEADIKFAQRFLIDNDLKGGIEITGDSEYQDTLLVFKDPVIKPAKYW